MNFMKFNGRIFCVFFLLFSSILFGQDNKLESEKILWRLRADTITSNLLRETTKISELERALLFAKIGDLWWKTDKNQADNYFEKSVDSIFFYSPDDKKNEYFDTTREILSIISSRNQKQTKRLIKILSDTDKRFEADKDLNADALIKFALQIVKDNPNQAFQIGIIALQTGVPQDFYKLFWYLRRYNQTLANQFFKEALAKAKTSPNYDMLQGVQFAVLPESNTTNFPADMSATPQQKIEVLNFLGDYLLELSAKKRVNAISSCASEAIMVSRSMRFFETLLPQKTGLVRQAIDGCLDTKSQSIFETLTDLSGKFEVEELLDLAEKNKDDFLLRTAYLTKAVLMAHSQKKYALIIKIVNNLTEKDLNNDLDFWQMMRYEATGMLAFVQFQQNDSQGAIKTLQSIPESYQPFAGIVFIKQFPANDFSHYNFRVGILDEIRQKFIKSDRPYTEKIDYWILLVKFYSDHKLEPQAADVFKEIVQDYNEFIAEEKENKTLIDSEDFAKAFSPKLLESQEDSIFQTVSSINQPKSRINVALTFLKISLEKYEILKSVPSKAGK